MSPLLVLVAAGALIAAAGLFAIRASGAQPRLARRLAGARQVRVGDVASMEALPARPVRVVGRIRCPNPIVIERGDRLVAYHRDVQVQPPGAAWRSIERVRETRGFELWDHDGSFGVDPALTAEPLVVIPHVWRGTTAELTDAGHLAALARLGNTGVAWPARSITRMISVVERLSVVADIERDSNGAPSLAAPRGGYVISSLELDDAMRLLGGNRRWLMLAGYVGVAIGAVLAAIGLVGSVLA
ncbi:MAG TPA: hypothetical protein VFL75_00540 [Candidatus Limnocylindria bacterium]|jgi:hypothetical protein|nr:hypothetical protein [Candidatus Limnocylindria bacterium]